MMLYEIISGQPPFTGPNYNALLRAIVESKPPTLESLSAADRELSKAVEYGMMKDRVERWQSMQELGAALARWLIQQDIFDDAAGVSLEAKWVNRRTDPSYRGSRPSLGSFHDGGRPSVGSIPEIVTVRPSSPSGTQPGSATRRAFSEAPTSVGPVVTTSIHPTKRRYLLPAAVALGLLAVVLLFWLRSEPSASTKTATVTEPTTAPAAPPAAAPAAVTAEAAAREPAAPPAPAPSAVPTSRERAPAGRRLARPSKSAAKPAGPAAPAGKSNDLMSPY